eukprot:TRINITY_DN51792_c0_g1_i2.p1 TRINITY_DN51792_c0_g1~~TRINITY_DN51792_c0_g1_i2.p1  ORF type:complete len:284 (-),score=31.19 TRINITY_DN51792_c0_g1_i2:885-1736(-)
MVDIVSQVQLLQQQSLQLQRDLSQREFQSQVERDSVDNLHDEVSQLRANNASLEVQCSNYEKELKETTELLQVYEEDYSTGAVLASDRSLQFMHEAVTSNVTDWLAEIEKCTLYHVTRCAQRLEDLGNKLDLVTGVHHTKPLRFTPPVMVGSADVAVPNVSVRDATVTLPPDYVGSSPGMPPMSTTAQPPPHLLSPPSGDNSGHSSPVSIATATALPDSVVGPLSVTGQPERSMQRCVSFHNQPSSQPSSVTSRTTIQTFDEVLSHPGGELFYGRAPPNSLAP